MLDETLVTDGAPTADVDLTRYADAEARSAATADAIRAALTPPPAGGRAEVRRQLRAARTLARKAQTSSDPNARAVLRRDAGTAFVRAVALKTAPQAPPRRDVEREVRPVDRGDVLGGERPRPASQPKLPELTPLRLDLPLGLADLSNSGGRLVQARLTGTQWRYEHLRALATRAAQDALAYEGEVLRLMEMALAKESAAQSVLTPALLAAIEQIKQSTSSVSGLTHDVAVDDALRRAADLVGQHLVLTMALEWFITHDVVEFWIGLLGALIGDVAAFDAGLGRTGRYLDEQFGLLGLKGELDQLTDELEARLDEVMQPIEDAVNALVADTDGAMRELFAGFDLPLTAGVAEAADGAVALDVNPLAEVEDALAAAVRRVRAEVKRELERVVGVDLAGTFRTVMIGFVVVPVLAVLAVGIAAGPFGAAVLAAVVTIGAQALVQLILSWLSGPLLDAADGLRRDALAALDGVRERVAEVLDVVNQNNPVAEINAVASQLRAITALLPQAFLDDAAELLDAARDVVVASAVDLALAAEQALGMENGTAFDAIAADYPSDLADAPLLPGGADQRRFSAQALLRDIGRLDQQRTAIRDSREFEIVHRVSLAQLLGATGFPQFRTQRSALVPLDADAMLGPAYGHGLYRTLIKEIRPALVLGSTAAAALPVVAPIALTVTHAGESRTRVKLAGNPSAPPVSLPAGVTVARQNAVVTELTASVVADALYEGVQRAVTQATATLHIERTMAPLEEILPQGLAVLPWMRGRGGSDEHGLRDLWASRLRASGHLELADRFLPDGRPDAPPHRSITLADAFATMRGAARDAVRRTIEERGGGDVDPDLVAAQVDAVLEPLAGWAVPFVRLVVEERDLDGATVVRPGGRAVIDHTATDAGGSVWRSAATARAYLNGVVVPVGGVVALAAQNFTTFAEAAIAQLNGNGGLSRVVGAAFADARAEAERHIAKWAGGRYEDDPLPAAGALGFVTLVRSDAPETACHSLAAPPTSAVALATAPASSPDGAPAGVAETLRYRPFENRGFTGTLRVSLPATLPFADLAVLQDVVLDVVVRACYDQDLADAVTSQQSLAPALMPAPVPAAPETHRVLVSLRALSGVTAGPLTLDAAHGETLPLNLGGATGLRIPLDALRVRAGVPVPALDSIEVLAAAAAVIPNGASTAPLPEVRPEPRLVAALGMHGFATAPGRFATLAMTTRRPPMPTGDTGAGPAPATPQPALPAVLASSLASDGVVPLFAVRGLGAQPVHDVLLSLTYRVRGGVGTVSGGGTVGGATPLVIAGITPLSGGAATMIRANAAPGSNFTTVESAELVAGPTSYPCVIHERDAAHVGVRPSSGTPRGTYSLRLNGPAGTAPALSAQPYSLTEAVAMADAASYTWGPRTMRTTAIVPVVVEGPRLDLVSGVRLVAGVSSTDVALEPGGTATRISFRPAGPGGLPPASGSYSVRLLGAGGRELLTLGTLEVTI